MFMVNYLVLDIETNASKRYGRQSHFLYDEIVAIGWKGLHKQAESLYIPVNRINILLDFTTGFIEDKDLIIGHNIKFDLLFLWPYLQSYFRAGGKVWDTAEVEYILSGQEHKFPALRDIAVNKYGCAERKKYIEYLLFDKKKTLKQLAEDFNSENDPFKKGIIREEMKSIESYNKVSDLPKNAVLFDVKNDVIDTEYIYLQQRKLIEEQGMLSLIEGKMDALLAFCEIEYNGVFINRDVFDKNKIELQGQLELKKNKLNNLIKEYWK